MMRQFLAVWVIASVLSTVAPVYAQQAAAPRLSLSPGVISVKGTFGQTVNQAFTLHNATGQGFDFEMSADDVIVRDGKRVFIPAGEAPHSIAATAVFSQKSGFVPAGSDKSVQVLLTVPAETDIRGVAVYFRAKHVVAEHGAVMLNASLGGLVTFTLTNDVSLKVQRVLVQPASASENLKVVAVLINDGREPVVPDAVAAFVDRNGSLVAKIPFNSLRFMPGEREQISAEYGGNLKPGSYRVLCTFSYAGKALTATSTFMER
jgi:hypothetical protein